jgi:site-specific DNA-methyltransferase (adenine-specific)
MVYFEDIDYDVKLLMGDCTNVISNIDEKFDLIIFSPPYAGKRKEKYDTVDPDRYAEWLHRACYKFMTALKPTGSMIVNLKEGVKGQVRQTYLLEFQLMMAESFNWVDTYIWNKTNPYPTGSNRRLKDGFEYCFHYTKTLNYQFYPNACLQKSTSKFLESEKRRKNTGAHNVTNGSGMNMSKRVAVDMVRPSTVFTSPVSCLNVKHCASFPVTLPDFFIRLLTKPGQSVLDPFCGKATTGTACIRLGRSFVGIDNNSVFLEEAKLFLQKDIAKIAPVRVDKCA